MLPKRVFRPDWVVFVWLCVLFAATADLVIDVDIKGCKTDMPITQGIAQTFRVPWLGSLDEVGVWIKPEPQYSTSYAMELWDNATLQPLGSSSTLSLASAGEGSASTWYSFSFKGQGNIFLKPNSSYKFVLMRLSPLSGAFSYCRDVYSDGSLYLSTSDPFPQNDMSFRVYATPLQLAHWTFDGHFDDISPAKLAPALPAGRNVALLGDFVSVRVPGYLELPRVDVQNRSFAVAFSLRIPSRGTKGTRFLYSDWSPGQWQFLSQIDEASTLTVLLRRNIETDGSNVNQDLVRVAVTIDVPEDEWFEVAWTFDRLERALSVYVDGRNVGTAFVRPSLVDVSLKNSNSTSYQFGRKNDELTNLDADLRHLRVYATSDVTLTNL